MTDSNPMPGAIAERRAPVPRARTGANRALVSQSSELQAGLAAGLQAALPLLVLFDAAGQ